MNLKDAQNIAERFCNNPKVCNITIADIRSALVILANFYEDYKHLLTKDDPDHPDYIDPFIDNDNPNFN